MVEGERHCLYRDHHGGRLDVEDQDSEIDERAGGANMVLGKSLRDLALVDRHGGRTARNQVAWIAFGVVGGMARLFFAWMESPVRVMV
jgi:hypothetical protein